MARALSPVIGVVAVVGITVLLATTVGLIVTATPTDPAPTATFDVSADSERDRISLTHRGGDRLVVAKLRVTVTVEGEPLVFQPPVPFFAARGFAPGPTGPLNVASDGRWRAGETGAFELAGTNSPRLSPGETVTVTIATETAVIDEVETTVQ